MLLKLLQVIVVEPPLEMPNALFRHHPQLIGHHKGTSGIDPHLKR